MVKTTINIRTNIKAKNIEIEEYELVMNVWRASMLFFEREIRKLHDKERISTSTLEKLAEKIDFTELLRMTFLSIKDSDRMRLVKLAEVAEAIQRVQQIPQPKLHDVIETNEHFIEENEPIIFPEQEVQFNFNDQGTQELFENSIKSILNQPIPDENQNALEIKAKDHLNVLQRNTASSVIELRKMMYMNIQKIRQTLSEDSG
jgi:hypothetical protein